MEFFSVMLDRKPHSPKQIANGKALEKYFSFLWHAILILAVGHFLHYVVVKYKRSWERLYRNIPYPRFDLPPCLKDQGLPSILLVSIFLIANLVLFFTPMVSYRPNYCASRLGWLAAMNMLLCVFLSLKNTPLRFILPTSYQRLNFFHRVVGYTALAQTLLHGILYTAHFGITKRWFKVIQEGGNREGLFAGAALLILAFGVFAQVRYMTFYATHLLGFIVMAIFMGLHRPAWEKVLPYFAVLMAGIWVFDRVLRWLRLAFNLINNEARLYPLEDGGVRLVFNKPLPRGSPGLHCFVWIPGIRCYKTYPFTITANSDSGLELVLRSYEGFTKEAYDLALEIPGRAMRASAHGPYGNLPNFDTYDKIVMIAGGSGASFTFGLVNFLLASTSEHPTVPITFVWAVRSQDDISWYIPELLSLVKGFKNVTLIIRVTREPLKISDSQLGELEQAPSDLCTTKTTACVETTPLLEDFTRKAAHHLQSAANLEWEAAKGEADLEFEKLQVDQAIWESIQFLDETTRVLIATCGPRSLTNAVRDAAQDCSRHFRPTIDILSENYDW
ncbi:unnamed protein product [Clonostachys chloroleuca]|uniref:FAD-binding FR-type domain-containing protein n=1 Tax=Clonostachys chloroleuca TaxID=1926264 RepID=A0AA35LXA1_9HYPO|nr:unnamed protein product [Clonostachys chloroleuca]